MEGPLLKENVASTIQYYITAIIKILVCSYLYNGLPFQRTLTYFILCNNLTEGR